MPEISIAAVDQAEASYAEAKATYYASEQTDEDKETFRAAKQEIVSVRSAWRLQEEQAGRRQVGTTVEGDAVRGAE